MDDTTLVLACVACACLVASMVLGVAGALTGLANDLPASDGTVLGGVLGAVSGGKGWRPARATYYHSYPPCCKASPNYDPAASKDECDNYDGCKYMGMFAGASGKKSYAWVRDTNIASVFETGQTPESWAQKWKNAKLVVRNPRTGKTLQVTVLDRCDDKDCGGCCTRNARQGGGMLVDLEYHTAARLWGAGALGSDALDWKRA